MDQINSFGTIPLILSLAAVRQQHFGDFLEQGRKQVVTASCDFPPRIVASFLIMSWMHSKANALRALSQKDLLRKPAGWQGIG